MTAKMKTKLEISDWELLQSLQEDLASNLKSKDLEKKLSDLLKIVELKYKIKDESQREKVFWELVEDLRKEVLENSESRKHPSTTLRASEKPEKHEKAQQKIKKVKRGLVGEEGNKSNENVKE